MTLDVVYNNVELTYLQSTTVQDNKHYYLIVLQTRKYLFVRLTLRVKRMSSAYMAYII